MGAQNEGQTVFDGIDALDVKVLDELSDEAKSLMEYAFTVGVSSPGRINVETYKNEFSKFEETQRVNISRFLLVMEELSGRELGDHYLAQSPEIYTADRINAVKKCLVVFKLLKAISSFVRVGDGVEGYDHNIAIYEDLLRAYDLVFEKRNGTAQQVVAATKDSSVPYGC